MEENELLDSWQDLFSSLSLPFSDCSGEVSLETLGLNTLTYLIKERIRVSEKGGLEDAYC